MINEFLQYLQYEKNYSFHTVLSYHSDLKQFCAFIQIEEDDFSPDKINSTCIQQWLIFLMSENLSARSLSRKISTLKSFWRFMLRNDYTAQNPTAKIILPKTKKPLPAFFKHKEMVQVLDDSFMPQDFDHVRNRLILEMFYMTGIRLSELVNVKDMDIDLEQGFLKVLGKRNKERLIPISLDFCKEIEHYMLLRNKTVVREDENLFVRSNGKKIYQRLVYDIVNKSMSEVSSLYKRSPHVLRHTFATSVLNNGADINAVKELLGHTSLAATQVYTHTSFEELYNIYKQAHPRAK